MFSFLEDGLTRTPSMSMLNTNPAMYAASLLVHTTTLPPMVIFPADTTWCPTNCALYLSINIIVCNVHCTYHIQIIRPFAHIFLTYIYDCYCKYSSHSEYHAHQYFIDFLHCFCNSINFCLYFFSFSIQMPPVLSCMKTGKIGCQ